MDKLKTIIQLLDKEEIREFRTFINRQKQKKDRLDLLLFEILLEEKEYKTAEILKKLYGNHPNQQAYHALRKRLTRHLVDFIVLKRMDEDNTTASSVMGLLSLSRYLFDKKAFPLAWSYIKKTEKQALSNELFPLLNNIYLVQMENYRTEFGEDLEEIIERWKTTKKRLEEEENAIVALSVIRKKLSMQRIEGFDQDLESIIPTILEEYNLSLSRPKLLHAVLSITRSAYLGRKDFKHFGPYAEKFYRIQRQKKVFNKANAFYRLDMLYMICHAHYRVLNSQIAFNYLKELREVIEENPSIGYAQFYSRYVGMLSAICFTTDKLQEAIEVTQSILEDPLRNKQLSKRDFFNHSLNLSVYFFAQKEYNSALETLSFSHTDKWVEKKMGKGWMLRKNLIELINYIEEETYKKDNDFIESRIRSIERQFKELFNQDTDYTRGKVFLKFIKKFINDPEWFNEENFENVILPNLQVISGQREDIQMMGFYSWLKAKSHGGDWYETFLIVLKNTNKLK